MVTLNKKSRQLLLIVFTSIFFLSCQKNVSNEDNLNPGQVADLTTKVTSSSVSGFVTDESNTAVLGADVSVGGTHVSTDKFGFFEVKNIMVVKNAATVVVNQPGYFKGIKTFIASENKGAFFRIKLIPKTNSGNFNATSGGSVYLSNGLIVSLPANAVVNAGNGTAYMGTVYVASHWLEPTAQDLNETMPGDLRGTSTDGSLKKLTTYGMAAVELTGTSGELLQIATGKKATLTVTIPASILSSAPASIPLWSFDENKGLWIEEGVATKTGNTYVGEVSHFSFWNYDVPGNYVQFNCTVKDATGNPIPFILVEITVAGTNNTAFGYTDASGYVNGAVPNNAQLILNIHESYSCSNPIYTQTFNTTNTNISLGNIIVSSNLGVATVSGTVTDCNNNPVTNGYLILLTGSQYKWFALSNTGTFNFSTLICNNSISATLVAEDLNALQQNSPLTVTLVTGTNTIGNLQACNNSIAEFMDYSINGNNYTFASPVDSITLSGNASSPNFYVFASHIGVNNGSALSFSSQGIGLNSIQQLAYFEAAQLPSTANFQSPISVNITEYGPIGQFISGNFTGVSINSQPPNTSYNVNCNFRVRRTF